ncbi:hypothetical protein MAPG_10007 [Magnaporthiopsis poae ATCC 64411]|uniref:Uncharacterized protein n=1 Tax=Magnaporthiopsis poae (strain ATCC 64411 / 73-15) TaxID=644358 RepID=A0A0C4EBG0_MAGP6|nr:hypothetical protein MAPG_10007 [Magnaporthiopsis poae ATCC 64411]
MNTCREGNRGVIAGFPHPQGIFGWCWRSLREKCDGNMSLSVWKDVETKRQFHELSSKLSSTQWEKIDHPRAALEARTRAPSSAYVLKLRHELKLGNHLALLAHNKQGVGYISAVCLEEKPDGLVVRVASNEKPRHDTISGLQSILNTLSRYSKKEIDCEEFLETARQQVMRLCRARIEQRTQSRGMKANMATIANRLETSAGRFLELRGHIRELREQISSGAGRKDLMAVVGKAQRVALSPDWKTAMALIGSGDLLGKMEEVNKLARYLNICDDMEKLGRWSPYSRLLGNISVVPCEGFAAWKRPAGIKKKCRIHAEVQLIMWYSGRQDAECWPPPRAIGCSKSACYLCHLLIQKMGKYAVSSTHGRFYARWTMPNFNLPRRNAEELQVVVGEMMKVMQQIELRIPTKQHQNGRKPTESRPSSILTGMPATSQSLVAPETTEKMWDVSVASSSSASTAITAGPSSQPPPCKDCLHSQGSRRSLVSTESGDEDQEIPPTEVSSSSVSSLHLEEADLPYEHHVGVGTSLFELRIGRLCMMFDCTGVAMGRLLVSKTVDETDGGDDTVWAMDAADIPTTEDLTLGCPEGTPALKMRLRAPNGGSVDVMVQWGDYPGRKAAMRRVKAGR